jgi:uncharacterized SAM-binding protein YcdF (DUF218 family)
MPMTFIVSKIFWAMFTPLTFITILIGVGALFRRYRWGRLCCGGGIILLLACGTLPIGHNLLVVFEKYYPTIAKPQGQVDGIIVLGGSIDLEKSIVWGQGQLNEWTPRITEMMALSQTYPQAKIIFTGGNGKLQESSSTEADELDKLLKKVGFDTSRIVYEGQSRNTYENAIFSHDIVRPQTGENWLLITSAFHMVRAEAIFQSVGWQVTPYPAGYITDGKYRYTPNLKVLDNMFKLQIVVKEMIGIMAYIILGKIKTDALGSAVTLPTPAPAI